MPDEPQAAPVHDDEDDDEPIFQSFRSRENRYTRLSESIFGNEAQQLREQIGLDAANLDAGTVDDDRFYRLWYSRPPWSNLGMSYRLRVRKSDNNKALRVNAYFGCYGRQLIEQEGLTSARYGTIA